MCLNLIELVHSAPCTPSRCSQWRFGVCHRRFGPLTTLNLLALCMMMPIEKVRWGLKRLNHLELVNSIPCRPCISWRDVVWYSRTTGERSLHICCICDNVVREGSMRFNMLKSHQTSAYSTLTLYSTLTPYKLSPSRERLAFSHDRLTAFLEHAKRCDST